jgi:hypothetical protein
MPYYGWDDDFDFQLNSNRTTLTGILLPLRISSRIATGSLTPPGQSTSTKQLYWHLATAKRMIRTGILNAGLIFLCGDQRKGTPILFVTLSTHPVKLVHDLLDVYYQ